MHRTVSCNGSFYFQVSIGSIYVSCCVLVRDMQRCVYAVPSPSVFPSSLLEGYQQECHMKDPGKQVEFRKRLQVYIHAINISRVLYNSSVNVLYRKIDYEFKFQDMSKDLKAELARKLMDMDVFTFRMVPVKVQACSCISST